MSSLALLLAAATAIGQVTSPPATEDSTLSLRVYRDGPGQDPLPYRPTPPRRDDPAFATDVTAVMTRCADGNLVISALVIGGRLTPLDHRCPTSPANSAPQCDATTWNCTTSPPKRPP